MQRIEKAEINLVEEIKLVTKDLKAAKQQVNFCSVVIEHAEDLDLASARRKASLAGANFRELKRVLARYVYELKTLMTEKEMLLN